MTIAAEKYNMVSGFSPLRADMGGMDMSLTLKDFELAQKRLEGIVHKTELACSTTF